MQFTLNSEFKCSQVVKNLKRQVLFMLLISLSLCNEIRQEE